MTPPAAKDSEALLAELDALLGCGPVTPEPQAEPPAGPEPLTAAAAPRPAPAPEAAPPPAAARAPCQARVVVVEDNKDYRRVLAYVLSGRGYAVSEARDGAEGLKVIRARRPHLVLLDFEMPGMNGYELLQELRRSDDTRKLPVVLLRGAANRRHLRSLALDVAEFIDKPIPNEDLLAAVERVLAARPPEPPEGATEEEPPPAEPAPGESVLAPEGLAAPPPAPEPSPGEAPAEAPDFEAAELAAQGDDLLIESDKKDEREEADTGLEVLAADSPLVNRVNAMLVRAVELGASDVHIEPGEKSIAVRVRVDGGLRLLSRLPPALQGQVAARVKIMANLAITERRRPQDGQIRAVIKGKKIEFRVSTVPSVHGEKVVLRILGGAKLKSNVGELGMSARDEEVVRRALQAPCGLLLVTGPTGSGKSTTLYTMLAGLNTPDVNIMTVEDPVEYELAGITQVPVKAHIGVTFEKVLRSFLRQDPDIMLVGEIRDVETAEIAVKAAITGHLVLSTLHTNSSPASIMRLTHMGLAPYLVADSLKLVVAQRLVRRLCPKCKEPSPPPEELARLVGEDAREQLKAAQLGKGCADCDKTGYRGRMPVFEVMEVRTAEMRHLILSAASADALGKQAAAEGMRALRQAALAAVAAGETSVEEALSIALSE